ncbi:MAG TPA: hypothetical protein VGE77_08195, partial [Nocardioides sp.]
MLLTALLSDATHLLAEIPADVLGLAADREEGPEPEDVKAGWTGFAVFIGLIVATVLLLVSMARHVRKVRREQELEQEAELDRQEAAA